MTEKGTGWREHPAPVIDSYRVDISTSPGQIDIEWTVRGGGESPSITGSDVPVRVLAEPTLLGNITDAFEETIREGADQLGVRTGIVTRGIDRPTASPDIRPLANEFDMDVSGFGSGPAETRFTDSISFQPARIPEVGGRDAQDWVQSNIRASDIPKLRITTSVDGGFTPLASGQDTTTLAIPIDAFVQGVSFESDCDAIHGDTIEIISQREVELSNAYSSAVESYERMEGIANDALRLIGVDERINASIPEPINGQVGPRDVPAPVISRDIPRVDFSAIENANPEDILDRRGVLDDISPGDGAIRDRVDDATSDIPTSREEIEEEADSRLEFLPDGGRKISDGAGSDLTSGLNQIRSELGSIEVPSDDLSSQRTEVQTLERSISDITGPCEQEIRPRVENLQDILSKYEQLLRVIEDGMQALSSLANTDFQSAIPERDDSEDTESGSTPSPDVPCVEQHPNLQQSLANFRQDALADFDPRQSFEGGIRDVFPEQMEQADNLRRRIETEVPRGSPCREVFTSIVADVEGDMRTLLNSRKPDEPEETEEDFDFGDRVSELDCADVPTSLQTDVSSFEGAVTQYTSSDPIRRTREKRDNLREEGEELKSRIRENIQDDNPCKSELEKRVSNALSSLESAGVRPESAIPCDERFSSVGEEIDNFEQTVLNLQAPVNLDKLEEINQQASQLISMIKSEVPADEPCRREMTSRVRNLLNRVDELTARVRVEADEGEAPGQERQEIIQNLFEQVDGVSQDDIPDEVDEETVDEIT